MHSTPVPLSIRGSCSRWKWVYSLPAERSLLSELRESNQRLQKLLTSPDIAAALQDAAGAMAGLRRNAESPVLSNSVAQFERTLRRIDQLVAGKDEDLQLTLENLRVLTDNLREFSENAKRFPAQLLFGKPPKHSKNVP